MSDTAKLEVASFPRKIGRLPGEAEFLAMLLAEEIMQARNEP